MVMSNALRLFRQGLMIVFAAGLPLDGVLAASPETPPAKALVEQALKNEIQGDAAGRREALLHAIFQDSDFAPARWQNGQLNYEGRWLDYQDVAKAESARPEFQEYLKIRDTYRMTAPDQLNLANWCRDRKLSAQEHAHLVKALELSGNPNNVQIRARLGHQFLGGVWMSPTEIAESRELSQRIRSAMTAWKPKLQLLSRQLRSPRTDWRTQARKDFLAIDDPDVLPLLEAVFSQDSPQSAGLLVELLSQMKRVEANQYLARQAVLSPYATVRQAATETLKSRPVETYAPLLLESMHTPIQSRVGLFVGRSGVRLTQVLFSESQDLQDVMGWNSQSLIVRQSQRNRRPFRASDPIRDAMSSQVENTAVNRLLNASLLDKQIQLYQRQRAVELRNDQMTEWNERVCETLRQTTKQNLPDDPQKWWAWWEEYNELHSPDEKPTRNYYAWEIQIRVVAELEPPLRQALSPSSPSQTPVRSGRAECLAAGTPIWTDRGFVAIDKIQIGDRVLSKHLQTGRLAYQPVLRTTVRPATSLMTTQFGSSEVTSTLGHTFWISGKGWQKVRDVADGSPFHTVDGFVKLESLQKAEPQPTYNLVVAGFHTYFVGPDMLLSHDVTFAEPVNNTVPGLEVKMQKPDQP